MFTNTADYLCYIEAVALLYEENVLKKCDFILDKNVFIKEHYDYKQFYSHFLDVDHKANEIFIVVDNTEWPEALGYNEWIGPE